MGNHPSILAIPSLPRSAVRSLAGRVSATEAARFIFAALLISEIPALLWYAGTHSTLYFRGWVNTEYLLLLCLGLLFPSWRTIALLTLELTIALLEPVAHLYYFSPQDALHSMRYLLLLPPHRLAEYGCLLAVYIVISATLLRLTLGDCRMPRARTMATLVLLCALLAASLDLASGRFYKYNIHIGPQPRDMDVRSAHAMRSPVASLVWSISRDFFRPRTGSSQPLTSALGNALAGLQSGDKPDIVLVLTESWGSANDARINEAQTQPYRGAEIARLYRVETGTVQFRGGTTSGETRELCGDAIGESSINRPQSFFAACWPARLMDAGYRTFAVHGFTPTMFSREEWYQRFGFQQSVFLPQLQRDGAAMCEGAFTGACDADVARRVGRELLAPRNQKPMFVHWVTLNSHLPVAPLGDGASREGCAAAGIGKEESLCSWLTHVLVVHRSVAELAVKPGLRPTLFVIVGDHAPPFFRTDLRDRFSQTSVPFVVLMPRSIPASETASLHPSGSGTP